MKNDTKEAALAGERLREYGAPWKGELVLVCRKCMRKVKKRGGSRSLASVKKWFKKRGRQDREGSAGFRVIGIDCVKMCPKDGVTVSRQHQLGRQGAEVSILRTENDIENFYRQVVGEGTRSRSRGQNV